MPERNVKLDLSAMPDTASTLIGVMASVSSLWIGLVAFSMVVVGLVTVVFVYLLLRKGKWKFTLKNGFVKRKNFRESREYKTKLAEDWEKRHDLYKWQ